MHSSVAYDKSKKEVLQLEVPQQPAFRQADVSGCRSRPAWSPRLVLSEVGAVMVVGFLYFSRLKTKPTLAN
jgi:hypothetical protein